MKKSLVLLICAGLIGCATIHSKDIMTEIISDPPGVKIEINNQYVGETPLTLNINRTYDWFYFWWDRIYINAIPTRPGQYVQTKYVSSKEPTPTKVYFNMYLTRPTPEYDINIRNR